MRRFLSRGAFVVLLIFSCVDAFPDEIRHQIAPGIAHIQDISGFSHQPLVANILKVDLKQSGVRAQTAIAQEVVLNDDPTKGREPLGSLASRHHALAAINGDFFPYTGDPLGIAIRDGELISEGMPNRAAMGITKDGTVVFDTLLCVGTLFAADGATLALDGINRIAEKDEAVVETPTFGAKLRCRANSSCFVINSVPLPVKLGQDIEGMSTQPATGDPNMAMPALACVIVAMGSRSQWLTDHIHSGDKIRFRFDFVRNPLPPGPPDRAALPSRSAAARARPFKSEWMDIDQAVGGGPWLVRDGKIVVDGAEEGFNAREFVQASHPRSAAGVAAGGELILVTIDGRQNHSAGMTLLELAGYMQKLGAVNAINLDGGGSSMMVVKDRYVNGPSDGEPRAIADALLIFGMSEDTPTSLLPSTEAVVEPVRLTAGQKVTVSLPAALTADGFVPFWGTIEGRAFINQQGQLAATHAGTGTIAVTAKAGELRIPFTVEPSAPALLTAIFSAAPNNPPDRNILTVRVTDAYKNGIKGQAIRVNVVGGVVEKQDVVTDSSGRAYIDIVWDTEAKGQAVITSGTLNPLTIRAK